MRPSDRRTRRLRIGGDVRLVRDEHDGDAVALIQFAEQRHDFLAGVGVEIAGRLVGQQQLGLVDQCACNGDALLLPAGYLVGTRARVLSETDFLQHLVGTRQAFGARRAAIDQRQGNVVFQARARQQVEPLEHEADHLIAQQRQFVAALRVHIAAIEQISCRWWPRRGSREYS